VKLTEEQFYQMWCRYAKEGKNQGRSTLGLGTYRHSPAWTRRDRMTAKGYVFPLLSQSAPVPTTDTHSLLILKDRVRTLELELKAAQRE
jgi:hypothetical protein